MKVLKRKKQKNKGGRPLGVKGPTRPKKYTTDFIDKESLALDKWINDKKNILNYNFWLGDFALDRGYSRQRLSEFAKENELFSDTLKKAKQLQENKLVKGAMLNKFNATMVIFALKNVAGWRDAKEVELSVSEELKEAMRKLDEIVPE